MLDAIEGELGDLADEPQRGNVPRELAAVGSKDYRQVFRKPNRIIYRVCVPESAVDVYLIVDGRRDLQALLARRLPDPPA